MSYSFIFNGLFKFGNGCQRSDTCLPNHELGHSSGSVYQRVYLQPPRAAGYRGSSPWAPSDVQASVAPASGAPLARRAGVKQERLSLQMKPTSIDTTQLIGLFNGLELAALQRPASHPLRARFPFKCDGNPLKLCHVQRRQTGISGDADAREEVSWIWWGGQLKEVLGISGAIRPEIDVTGGVRKINPVFIQSHNRLKSRRLVWI